MTTLANTITEQALSLPTEERERLHEALLISLNEPSLEDEVEFLAEIRDRRAAFLRGELTARSFNEILKERLPE